MQQPVKIYQYDLRGKFVAEHKSIIGAARSLRKEAPNISRVLRGLQRTAYGYQWSYVRHESMEAVTANYARMATIEQLKENLSRELPVVDHGIVTKEGHREYGKHKIKLGTMEIYFKPGKSVEEIVEKYSRVSLD